MQRKMVLFMGLLVCLTMAVPCYADQTIIAKKVTRAPVIDGKGNDPAWTQATEYTTYDEVAKVNVNLKAVYTDSEIFFLVNFPDPDESPTHKTWTWNEVEKMYKLGPDREDTFVFKWNMETKPVDLSLKSDDDYIADVWFWKACRTNPSGYADDKYQQFSNRKIPKTAKMTSKSGRPMYLLRLGDKGTRAYKDTLYVEYQGDRIPQYTPQIPTGSRADIKAKGVWSDGRWTIEFSRALNTGNDDDVQFDTSKTYLFGVSCYEMAGRKPIPDISTPLYGCGDVSEALTLKFGE